MEPATYLPAGHALLASFAPRTFSSSVRSARPYAASLSRVPPKVFVSTKSLPASKYAWWMFRTTSARVSFQSSGQAPSVRPASKSSVPMAPSKISTSDRNRSRNSFPLACICPLGCLAPQTLQTGNWRRSAAVHQVPVSGSRLSHQGLGLDHSRGRVLGVSVPADVVAEGLADRGPAHHHLDPVAEVGTHQGLDSPPHGRHRRGHQGRDAHDGGVLFLCRLHEFFGRHVPPQVVDGEAGSLQHHGHKILADVGQIP